VQKTAGKRMRLNGDTPSGDLALDTGVIIEMLLSSDLGGMITEALVAESAEAHSSEVNLTEAEYVLCRKLGWETAESKVDNLRRSNYVLIADTEQVSKIAARIKCERALAFGDCYTLATAKATSSKALFAFREKKLQREMRRRPFDVQLIFLEDMMKE
jgi:predicted nucleic acid-binding protein